MFFPIEPELEVPQNEFESTAMTKIHRFPLLVAFLIAFSVVLGGCAGESQPTKTTQASNANGEAGNQTANELDSSSEPEPTKVSMESMRFSDINGELHDPFADVNVKAVSLVFIATDCPIANYFQPTLAKLAESYTSDGVQFFLVHANPDLKLDAAVKHAEEFAISSPVIMDNELTVARNVHAKVTPEAFVIDREGNIRYRGRINDLYVDYGKKRRVPTANDLRDAIEAVVRDEEVANKQTKAVGCYIPYPRPVAGAQ